MTTSRLLLVPWLLLFLVGQTRSFGWLRSRRCSRVNCAWGGWLAWGACSDPCGNAGTQSRSRGISRSASCGGSSCSGPSSQTQACDRFCYNGGTLQSGHCDCTDEFWDTCCDKPCTQIDHCSHRVCSSGTNQQCRKCNYDYGGDKKAYRKAVRSGYSDRICEKICSWRPDSTFCYPGNCPGTPSSCQCAPGFGATNCLTISTKPIITNCFVTAEVTTSSSTEKVEIGCEKLSNTVIYTNFLPYTVKVLFSSFFKGPSVVDFPRQYYINDFTVGVTNVKFTHFVVRDSLGVTRLDNEGCRSGMSRDRPYTSALECNLQNSIQNTPLQHEDRVHFEVSVSNGGYVKIRNFDSGGTIGSPKYYTGQTITHKAELVIDLVKPAHCSVRSTCSDNMLDRGPPITKATNLAVRWAGWSDGLAGIDEYELELFKLQPHGDKLAHRGIVALASKSLSANSTSFNTILVEAGVYAVVLTVEDKAGNSQAARRFLIFDNKNTISLNTSADKQLRVNSAAENTSYTWLTTLRESDNAGVKVDVVWGGHFANVFHHTHKFLAGIAPNSPPVDAGYDETTGQPPNTVSMEAIPNVNAIVKYEFTHAIDHLGGRSITAPAGWVNVTAFQSEKMTVDVPRADGDSVRVWVRATDVMGNTKTDSVLVHVDSSPPVIQDVRLDRHGDTQPTEPYYLTYEVDTYDFHSGVKEIQWQLRDSQDPEKLYDSGQMNAHRHTRAPADCVTPRCYCIPKNTECYLQNFEIKPDMSKIAQLHSKKNFNHELVLSVTNNAMLTTIYTYKYSKDKTTDQPGNAGEIQRGNAGDSISVPVIAGGSVSGVAVIAIAAVVAVYCIIKKSRNRETLEANKANTEETKKETDTEEPHYTALQFNNPEFTGKEDDEQQFNNPEFTFKEDDDQQFNNQATGKDDKDVVYDNPYGYMGRH